MNKPITVIVADDHPMFRKGLSFTLSKEHGFDVVGEAEDGLEALELVQKFIPNIAILDIEMPKLSGIEVAQRISEEDLDVKTIILSMYKDEYYFEKALDAGVMGYLLKDNAIGDMMKCIETVMNNNYFISASISDFLIKRRNREIGKQKEIDLKKLSVSERRIFNMIAEGKDSKGIAEELYISIKTVENHRANICRKLNLTGSHILNKFAASHLHLVER